MKKFIAQNVVIISGILSALTLVLQQAISNHSTDYKAIGIAAIVAILSFIANAWKGQGITFFGIVATLAGVFVQQYNGTAMDWNTFALAALFAITTTLSSGLNAFKNNNS